MENKSARLQNPTYAKMVVEAVKSLEDKKGSSLQAIKKEVISKYNLDPERSPKFIVRALKFAVETKALVKTTGTGATGSYKLPKTGKKPETSKEKVRKAVTVVLAGQKKSKVVESKAEEASPAPASEDEDNEDEDADADYIEVSELYITALEDALGEMNI